MTYVDDEARSMTPVDPPATEIGSDFVAPTGFRFAGVHCGIKLSRLDLGVVISDRPASAAGCFTRNPVQAACVRRNRQIIPQARVRAVIANSGNANAMTGEAGDTANTAMATAVADQLGCAEDAVLTLSTGVIGVLLNPTPIVKAVPRLLDIASADPRGCAEAILTTDTSTKLAHTLVELPGQPPIRILGIAKGSGMIHPNMATTLACVCTDAAIAPDLLQRLLSQHIDDTFNAITVDGDTSTNDTVLLLANGASDCFIEGEDSVAAFSLALRAVLESLAVQVARDGEGATRLLRVHVNGAPNRDVAQATARAICRSSLFKCAIFTGEANWGRLAAAAGQAACERGFAIDPGAMRIRAQGIELVAKGIARTNIDKGELGRRLRAPDVTWSVDLGHGDATFTAYGCDLTYDYVRINADEAQQVEVTAGGSIARNLTLAAYSPRLKHQLLVDGLSYVRRFTGLRALIHVQGAAAEHPDLLASLSQDLELCLDAGLRPLVVVPSQATATAIEAHMHACGHFASSVSLDAHAIASRLDRGHLCVAIEQRPDPGEMVDLAIRLGIQKFIALGDAQGLHDGSGLVSTLTPDVALAGLDRGRFESTPVEFLVLARHAARRSIPALHLIDGRLPHALVGELFTNQGVGTLITRQTGN